jgi:hypothetical protein
VEYCEGEGPVLPPLRDEAGVQALMPQRLAEAIATVSCLVTAHPRFDAAELSALGDI